MAQFDALIVDSLVKSIVWKIVIVKPR